MRSARTTIPFPLSRLAPVALLALLALLVASLAACTSAPAPAPAPQPTPFPARLPDPTSGEQVLALMHDRYAGQWYRSLTFVQRTTTFRPSGDSTVATWYEAGAIPGRLRIDFDLPAKGNGVLYANDSLYAFSGGRLASATRQLNDLAVLGFDVYGQPVARTMEQLRGQGFDLSRLREDTWQGKAVWVVGRVRPDSTSREFWVEKERLLFVRLLETRTTPQGARHVDLRFERYVQHGGGWVAERVEQLVDDRPRLTEVYRDVRVDVPLADALFDPKQWGKVPHWLGTAK